MISFFPCTYTEDMRFFVCDKVFIKKCGVEIIVSTAHSIPKWEVLIEFVWHSNELTFWGLFIMTPVFGLCTLKFRQTHINKSNETRWYKINDWRVECVGNIL